MFSIRKLFKFESAHMLDSAFSQECLQMHGHSYKMEVILESEKLNDDGMVIDFKLLKQIINSIIGPWDHAVMISRNNDIWDRFKIWRKNNAIEDCADIPIRGLIYTDFNPTAENMAKTVNDEILNALKHDQRFFGHEIHSICVRIHETDTGWAQYKRLVNENA